MLWSRLDTDLIKDPDFIALEDLQPGALWLFVHCLTFARVENHAGKILYRGRHVGPIELSRVANRTREDCEAFFKLSLSLGIIEHDPDTGIYSVADWKRWHEPPSGSPEAVRERVRKHREKTRVTDVTACNVVTDVTTQSIAEHSIAEQEQSKASASAEQCAGEDDEEGPGRDELVQIFLQLQPSLSAKFIREVAGLRRVAGALPEDVLAAARAAVAKTRWLRDHGAETISRPPAYALELARGNIPQAIEWRQANEFRRSRNLPVEPYAWKPPEEDRDCA